MIGPYPDPLMWIKKCNSLIGQKFDSLTLYSGDEGMGKSYTMLLLESLKDPEAFKDGSVDRIHFKQKDYIRQAGVLPVGSAISWDEATVHKRKAMHGFNIRYIDLLTTNRGRRLHQSMCYPDDEGIDTAILNRRLRWNVHVPARGLAWLRVRRRIETNRGVKHKWALVNKWTIPEIKGALQRNYDAAKEAYMESLSAIEDEEPALDYPAIRDVASEIRDAVQA